MTRNHKHHRNPAIDRHMVIFDLTHGERVVDFLTQVHDCKRARMLIDLTLDGKMKPKLIIKSKTSITTMLELKFANLQPKGEEVIFQRTTVFYQVSKNKLLSGKANGETNMCHLEFEHMVC
jgi:hypothetical protein